jgi:hypothetical protein
MYTAQMSEINDCIRAYAILRNICREVLGRIPTMCKWFDLLAQVSVDDLPPGPQPPPSSSRASRSGRAPSSSGRSRGSQSEGQPKRPKKKRKMADSSSVTVPQSGRSRRRRQAAGDRQHSISSSRLSLLDPGIDPRARSLDLVRAVLPLLSSPVVRAPCGGDDVSGQQPDPVTVTNRAGCGRDDADEEAAVATSRVELARAAQVDPTGSSMQASTAVRGSRGRRHPTQASHPARSAG